MKLGDMTISQMHDYCSAKGNCENCKFEIFCDRCFLVYPYRWDVPICKKENPLYTEIDDLD